VVEEEEKEEEEEEEEKEEKERKRFLLFLLFLSEGAGVRGEKVPLGGDRIERLTTTVGERETEGRTGETEADSAGVRKETDGTGARRGCSTHPSMRQRIACATEACKLQDSLAHARPA